MGALLGWAACGDNRAPGQEGAYACPPRAPTSCPDPSPRYADVAPVIQQHCLPCHFGEPQGPWPLYDYRHVADWQDVVRDEVLSCAMPPADSGLMMPTQDREAILTWILCGFPE